MQKAARFYFSQTEHYMSERQDALIKIADMHPNHAGNAARRLLIDGAVWAEECGRASSTTFARWMIGTPLWRALQERAAGDE